jgi:hypothetical protein
MLSDEELEQESLTEDFLAKRWQWREKRDEACTSGF